MVLLVHVERQELFGRARGDKLLVQRVDVLAANVEAGVLETALDPGGVARAATAVIVVAATLPVGRRAACPRA